MKSSLELHIGQQLTLTPQLQQAIRLLQLSTLELQQEIHSLFYNKDIHCPSNNNVHTHEKNFQSFYQETHHP